MGKRLSSRGPEPNCRLVAEPFEHGGSEYLLVGYELPRLDFLADLSVGELEVIRSWIDGLSMRDIASRRGSAVRTVANQIASVYAKVGVGSRAELLHLVFPPSGPSAGTGPAQEDESDERA